MLRFTSSPTHDMTIAELRVALFNYIMSIQRNEPLLVRIEDTDKDRNIPSKEEESLAILNLFGIKYQEHHFQSNNLRYHRAMALQLLHDKKAFNCFCQEGNQTSGSYDGGCDNLPHEEVIDNPNPFRIRLKKPHNPINVSDMIQGDLSFSSDDIDSFIIMDTQKFPTLTFASAVDDMLSDVSLIIQSDEYLSKTPQQIAVQRALGYDRTIEYAHIPTVLDADSISVKWLLEEGFLPSAICNYLLAMGNTIPCEIFTLDEAIKWFDLTHLSRLPVDFDIEKLRKINREHLRGLDPKELSRYVGFADDEIGRLAKLFLDEASTLKELRPKISAIFEPKNIPDEFQGEIQTLRHLSLEAPHFDDYEAYTAYLSERSGLKVDQFTQPLRLLLSGSEQGPQMSDMYAHLKNYLKEVIK